MTHPVADCPRAGCGTSTALLGIGEAERFGCFACGSTGVVTWLGAVLDTVPDPAVAAGMRDLLTSPLVEEFAASCQKRRRAGVAR